jgi:pimeloyl-ACP methyl ester carboxylesterase
MRLTFLLLIFLIAFSRIASANTTIVFVPGAHFDGSSFKELAMKFPYSHTIDFSLPSETEDIKKITLSDYANRVCDVVTASREDVVLVGHSQGGAVINHSLGLCPQNIRALIYIAAVIPLPGETSFMLFEPRDDEYYFQAVQQVEELGLFKVANPNLFVEGFSQDSTIEQGLIIRTLMRNEPIGPSKTKVEFKRKVFDSLPKLVVTTKNDRIITPKTQRLYYDRIQASQVLVLESGHLPMVTKVNELQRMIRSFVLNLK